MMTLEQEFGSDIVYGAKLHEEMLAMLDTIDGIKGAEVLPDASDYKWLARRVLSEKHYTRAQCEEMLADVEPYKLRAFVQVHDSAALLAVIDINLTTIRMDRTPKTDYETRIRLVDELDARLADLFRRDDVAVGSRAHRQSKNKSRHH
jgi:hypothetical protein